MSFKIKTFATALTCHMHIGETNADNFICIEWHRNRFYCGPSSRVARTQSNYNGKKLLSGSSMHGSFSISTVTLRNRLGQRITNHSSLIEPLRRPVTLAVWTRAREPFCAQMQTCTPRRRQSSLTERQTYVSTHIVLYSKDIPFPCLVLD